MSFSNQELALIHEVASGSIPFDERLDLLIDREGSESVYKLLLSDSTITTERKADLEREIIESNLGDYGYSFSDILWDFDHGYLRHRFVAEMMSDRGKKGEWFDRFDDGIIRVFHYLFDDYHPENGEPSKKELLLYMVMNYDYHRKCSPNMIDFINIGLFDGSDADTKANVLRFILFDYNSGVDSPCVEDVVLAWIRRGLVSALPGKGLQELMKWVDSRPNKIDYMEAGLWHILSTHERAKMIAPFLDKAETVLEHLPDLSELKSLYRLLRLEGNSPLFQETMDELHRINYVYFYSNPCPLFQ